MIHQRNTFSLFCPSSKLVLKWRKHQQTRAAAIFREKREAVYQPVSDGYQSKRVDVYA